MYEIMNDIGEDSLFYRFTGFTIHSTIRILHAITDFVAPHRIES